MMWQFVPLHVDWHILHNVPDRKSSPRLFPFEKYPAFKGMFCHPLMNIHPGNDFRHNHICPALCFMPETDYLSSLPMGLQTSTPDEQCNSHLPFVKRETHIQHCGSLRPSLYKRLPEHEVYWNLQEWNGSGRAFPHEAMMPKHHRLCFHSFSAPPRKVLCPDRLNQQPVP